MLPLPPKSAGFSLLELVVALALGMIAIVVIASNATLSEQLRREFSAKDALLDLETRAREAARYGLALSRTKSKELARCLDEDKKGCPAQWTAFDLLRKNAPAANGRYGVDGRACAVGPSCVVVLETSFLGACPKPGCDAPALVYVKIATKVGGNLVREVIEPVVVRTRKPADENVGCGVGGAGTPKFAQGLARGTPTCVEVKAPKPRIVGVQPGSCAQNKQILAGFSPSGEPICEDAIFDKQ